MTGLYVSYRVVCDHKHVGWFQSVSHGFLLLENQLFSINIGKFLTYVFSSCLIVTESYYGVVQYLS